MNFADHCKKFRCTNYRWPAGARQLYLSRLPGLNGVGKVIHSFRNKKKGISQCLSNILRFFMGGGGCVCVFFFVGAVWKIKNDVD